MTLDFYFLLFLVRHPILLGRIITCRILASYIKSRHRKGDNSNMRKVVCQLMKIGINKVQVKIKKKEVIGSKLLIIIELRFRN